MRVDVYGRARAEATEPTENTVVISITNPEQPAFLQDGWKDILRLEFHDVVSIPRGMHECVAFHTEHIDLIHAFVAKHEGCDFMVHCDAGVSRSVAVGRFLREVHDADLHLYEIHTDEHCNSRVLRGLKRKSWNKQLAN
jgi:predicted protein tyrosine phosphatase